MNLTSTNHAETNVLASISELPDLAVFDIVGVDAVNFIQGQITNDIAGADMHTARLAGYCTAQGRLLATMVLCHAVPSPDGLPDVLGIIKRDILTSVLKRLTMFVLRAKAKLAEKSCKVYGVELFPNQHKALEVFLGSPLDSQCWSKTESPIGTWISAPTVGEPRWWLIVPEPMTAEAQKLKDRCQSAGAQDWQTLDISAGLPWIEAATQDLFIPQTLNLDLIEGVSFTKGCYPGQEIVARSHYRGTLKRRMMFGVTQASSEEIVPGTDVFDASQAQQACGRLINVSKSDKENYLLLESSFDAAEKNQLRVGNAEGLSIELKALPYNVIAEKKQG